MTQDFFQYVDNLIQIYRFSEKIDGAGATLGTIFRSSIDNSKNV